MFNVIKTATLSAMIGLSALAAIPVAHADSLYLGFGNSDDDSYFRRQHRHDDRDWRPDDRYWRADDRGWRRFCSPDRALDKAERMGLHRARIVDINRRTVKVAGRQDGDRVLIVFANERGCPILYR
jgi:hypothetical protein